MTGSPVTLSVVSHGQIDLVNQFLDDLSRHCPEELCVILTHNIPEPAASLPSNWRHRLEVIANDDQKGFGANHNTAFRRCVTPLFCVANPDIRLSGNPFPILAAALERSRVAVAGPLVLDPQGRAEDSARKFPTAGRLLHKLFTPPKGPDYRVSDSPIEVDWLAGMFMAFRAEAFRAVKGFDERFYLYYEDVDICARLSRRGYSVVYAPEARITHDARRASRRDMRLMRIHLASALRYLSTTYRR